MEVAPEKDVIFTSLSRNNGSQWNSKNYCVVVNSKKAKVEIILFDFSSFMYVFSDNFCRLLPFITVPQAQTKGDKSDGMTVKLKMSIKICHSIHTIDMSYLFSKM